MLGTRRRGADCAGVACEHTLGRQPLHLYGYLWTKPEYLVDDQSGRFSFVVPDTVLFKQQKPVKWFFTSRQEQGKILTKSKKNVNVTEVLQAFLEQPKQLATSARGAADTTPEDGAIVATYVYPDRSSNGELVMVLEHLTATGLQRLLLEREKPPISVLQRFIPTKSGYNHLIQSVFTADSCLLRKCVNANVVSDTRLCLPERAATFEADERLVKPRDVTNRELRDQIEHMHLEMSNHLKKIIGKPVARNVAYFKHGADGRMYLLWSTMLSFETGSLAFAKNMRLSLSHQDRLQHLIATTAGSHTLADKMRSTPAPTPSTNPQMKMCPACRSILPSSLVEFVATFKAIISAFEADPRRHDSSCIPPLLEPVLPPTSDERFKELSFRKEFLYRTIALCQPCAKRISSTKKPKPTAATGTSQRSQTVTTKTDRDRPIYMQSAHSIFWGKVEREEAAREQNGREYIQSRPRSAISARPNPRIRTLAASRRQALSNGSSLKRLLPDIADRWDTARVIEPTDCAQTVAEHLRQTCGHSSPDSDAASLSSPPGRSHHLQLNGTMLRDSTAVFHTSRTSVVASLAIPAPPAMRRPSSYGTTLPPSARVSRLERHSKANSTNSRPVRGTNNVESDGTHMKSPPKSHIEASKSAPTSNVIRSICGVACDVQVCVIGADDVQSSDLKIRAFPLRDSSGNQEKMIGSRPEALELTLNTGQILEFVACSSHSAAGGVQVPPTGDALVEVILDGLTIQDGRLFGPSAESLKPDPTTPLPHANSPIASTDSSLTAVELRFLHETLRQY